MGKIKTQVSFKNFFLQFWPFLFLISIWFIFSAPYFLQHKILYPAQYQVSFFTPWNVYPQYAGPVKNNALSDVVNELYPWKHFTIEELKKGRIPLWNPYSFSGTPHLANYQSAVFSPFNLLFFIFPFIDAWSLVILLQPLLAGLFLYLFLREVKVSSLGSILGSVTFMFCGFMTVWMAYGTLAMSIAFLPLSLFALEKIFNVHASKNNFKNVYLFILSLSIAFSFLSGHFQISLYFACYTFAFLWFRFFLYRNKRSFNFALLFFAIGIGISLLQILPSLTLYKFAVRSELFSNNGGIPWFYLVTSFAPDFFGNPVTRNDWIGHYAEWASFIGMIPLSFIIFSIVEKKNRTVIFFFFGAGLLSLLLALDTPLQQVLALLKIPIFSTSIPSRIIVLSSFSFAVLAGFGLDTLRNLLVNRSYKKLFSIVGIIGLFLVILWLLLLVIHILPQEKINLARRNLFLPSLLFCLLVGVVLFTISIKNKMMINFALGILLVASTFDSLRFATKWTPFEERIFLYPTVPVISAMQKDIGQGRVYGDFGAYIDIYYHLPSIEGYDPLYSKHYGEFIETAKTGKFFSAIKSEVRLQANGKYSQRVLDLLGVTLIYQPIAYTNKPWGYPVWEKPSDFPTLYRDDNFALFKNTNALPRAKFFSTYEIHTNQKELLKRFYTDDFDYRNILLLEEDPGIPKSKQQNDNSYVKIVSYTSNKVTITVRTTKKGLLFLSDSYYPAWKALVNGKATKIYLTDYAFRSVPVPVGESTVIFYYQGLL